MYKFFHKSVKMVKSHFSLSVKCYEHDDSKIISPVDDLMAQTDSNINGEIRFRRYWQDKSRENLFQINIINENSRNNIQL